jgi:hypothetical protein
MNPLCIKTAAFWLVAQFLNQLCHHVPQSGQTSEKYFFEGLDTFGI